MKAKRNITYATFTDIGSRSVNEDSLGCCELADRSCFILCDGLGGHGMGDVASSLTVEVMKTRFEGSADNEEYINSAFLAAQDILLAEQKKRNAQRKMKTTAATLAVDDKQIRVGHIGDSRVYLFRKNKVMLRSRDHSIPQMLFESGDIKDSEIRNHPERNTVLRVMGVEWEKKEYELLKPIPIRKCQAALLCSDGFWELIDEENMCRYLYESASVSEWLEKMAAMVKKNGEGKNMDNNTAIAVWF